MESIMMICWLVSLLLYHHVCVLYFVFLLIYFYFCMLDVIGVVDNVEEKVHSKNVVFDLKDLRLVSLCMLFYIYSSVLII